MDPPIPPNFQVGSAEQGADSFFDSVAKCLQPMTPKIEINVRSLRKICAEHAKIRPAEWWFAEIVNEDQTGAQYAKNVRSAMWGRPEIEGRIICRSFGVNLHVLEKRVGESDTHWNDKIISPNFNRAEDINYDDPNQIHIIDLGDLHFQPILNTTGDSAHQASRQEFNDDAVKVYTNSEGSSNSETSDEYETMQGAKSMPNRRRKKTQGAGGDKQQPILNKPVDSEGPSNPENSDDHKTVQGATSKPIKSKKAIQGTGGDKGQFYEIKLTILLYLRALTNSHCFFLEREVSKAGKFDDLVLTYYKNEEDLTHKRANRIFLQLKHKLGGAKVEINKDHLLGNKGYYSAAEYFRSYMEFKSTFDGSIGDCNFVIYTNAGYNADITDIVEKLNETDFSDILVSKENCQILQLKKVQKVIDKLCSAANTKRLAQVIYQYAFGNKKGETIRFQEIYIADYQIPLANHVFEENPPNVGGYKFKKEFLNAKVGLEAEMLLNELSDINKSGINPQKLETAHFELFKGFGGTSHKLTKKDSSLAQNLAKIINESKSENVVIDERKLGTISGINKLAGNILVRDNKVNDGNEWVKFREGELSGINKKFIDDMQKCVDTKRDLKECSFLISGFPKLSLPISCDDAKDDDITGFLKNFYIFVGQSNEGELDDIIKLEIENTYGVSKSGSGDAFPKAQMFVQKWRDKEAISLTENEQFLADEISKMNRDKFAFQIQGIDIQFDGSKMSKLTDLLCDKSVLTINSKNGAQWLSVIRVIQAMETEKHSWALVTWDQLKKANQNVLRSFYGKDYLVVCGCCTADHEIALKNLAGITDNNSGKKVIVITEVGECEIDLHQYFKVNESHDDGIFKDLTRECQDALLMKSVTFQGGKTELRNILNIEDVGAENVIGSETLMSISNRENIIISKELQRLGDLEAAYIKMYLAIPVENLIDALLRKSNKKSIYLFHGVGKSQDQSTDVFVDLFQKEDGTDRAQVIKDKIQTKEIKLYGKKGESEITKIFKALCRQEGRTVYLLQLREEEFILQQIYDPQFYMKREIRYPNIVRIDIKVLFQENMTDYFIIQGEANKDIITNNLKDYPNQYDIRCNQGKIIFVEDIYANDKFHTLCKTERSVEWIEIDEKSKDQCKLLGTHGPSPISHKGNILQPVDLMKNTTFLISGKADEMIVRKMLEDNLEKNLKRFEQNCSNGNISFVSRCNKTEMDNKQYHWLSIHEDALIWARSNKSLKGLRDFAFKELDIINENGFSKMAKSKCVIIADDPGMGKSTTLTSFSEQLHKTNWVLRIDFRECLGAIKALPSNNEGQELTFDDVCDFFSRVNSTGLQSDLAKRLFKHKLQPTTSGKRPIIILFDAFDEINTKQQEQIIVLLKFLKDKSQAKLLITTRRNKMEELEDALSTFAANIKELNEMQQHDFLFNFWRICVKLFRKHYKKVLRNYAKKLIEQSTEVLGKKILLFMGVPLQLRLLAEGFQNEVLHYFQRKNDSFLKIDSVDILSLYQKFIKQKYDIFFKEKIQLPDHNAYITENISECFNRDHQNLAWTMLFPKEKMLNKYTLSKKHESDLKSVGIIQSQGSEGMNYFIHRTFAEFFVADLIVGNLGRSKKIIISTTQFLMKNLFLGENIVIKRFIDQMLSEESPILVAALKGDLEKLLELLKDNRDAIVVDKLERTALHLAAQEGQIIIVEVLLDSGYSALKSDRFGKTCLHYAAMNGHKQVVDHLTNYITDVDIHDNLCRVTLHEDQEIGDIIFTKPKHLSSKLVKLVNYLDVDGQSSLQCAVRNEYWGVACSLIANGAYITCLTEDHLRNIHMHAIGTLKYGEPWYNPLFPVIGLLLMKSPTIFSATGESEKDRYDEWYYDKSAFLSFVNSANAAKENDDRDITVDSTNEHGQTSLHSAAKYYDLDEVKYLVSNGANVNIADKNGKTALDYALDYNTECDSWQMKDTANTVKYLFEHNAKSTLNDIDLSKALEIVKTGRLSSFHDAVILPTTFAANYLLHLGADINMNDMDGKTPLHHAALNPRNESEHMVKFLLEKGAMYNLKDDSNKTVLDYLDLESHVYELLAKIDEFFNDISKLDFDALRGGGSKSICNACNENGDTLLHLCVRQISKLPYHVLKWSCVNVKNNQGNTPLHLAAAVGNYDFVNDLIQFGAVINSKNNEGCTPLEIARNKQHIQIIDTLQEFQNSFIPVKKDNLDEIEKLIHFSKLTPYKNSDGKTLMHAIAQYGYTSMIKYYYTDLNYCNYHMQCDFNGCAPLHYAAESGHTHMVYELLKFCAAYNPKNNEGKRPIDLAKSQTYDFLNSLHIMFDHAKNNNLVKFKEHLTPFGNDDNSFSAVINATDRIGNTLLHLFARRRNFEAVIFLLQKGAPYDIKHSVSVYGQRIEDFTNYVESLFIRHNRGKYLLNEENVHQIVNSRNDFGETLLHIAYDKEIDYYKLNYLVNNGADVNATCKFGKTVLDKAISRLNSHDLTKYLLMKGAKISLTDASIFNALRDTCMKGGRLDIAVMLDRMR